MKDQIGCCDCGELEYKLKNDPINVAFCYCTACQVHTNSDKWYGLWIRKDDYERTKGTPSVFIRKGGSGKNMEHNFCSNCGTTVSVFVEVANMYSVAANTLKTSEAPRPNMLIYTKNAASWALYPEGVPKYEILPPEYM